MRGDRDISKFVETPTSKKIFAVLRYAGRCSDVGVIYGGAGVGKTVAVKKFSREQANCWVMTVSTATASVKPCLEEIALAVGLRDYFGGLSKLQREIVGKLEDAEDGLLIIDEAQHLPLSSLEAVRYLFDQTDIGLVLCGNESVYARLTAGGTRTAAFAQLFSRIGKKLHLPRSLPGDVHTLAESFGINGAKEMKFIEQIGQTHGSLRMVVKTLNLASVFARQDGGKVDLKNIELAWRDLAGHS